MKTFVRCASLLLALFAGSLLSAQTGSCPFLRARTVPTRQEIGPLKSCGGIEITLHGVRVSNATGCPLFVVHYPEHEVPEASPTPTYIREYTQVPVLLFRFECKDSWFLFIPLGSSCVHRDFSTLTMLSRYTTLPCPTDRADT